MEQRDEDLGVVLECEAGKVALSAGAEDVPGHQVPGLVVHCQPQGAAQDRDDHGLAGEQGLIRLAALHNVLVSNVHNWVRDLR